MIVLWHRFTRSTKTRVFLLHLLDNDTCTDESWARKLNFEGLVWSSLCASRWEGNRISPPCSNPDLFSPFSSFLEEDRSLVNKQLVDAKRDRWFIELVPYRKKKKLLQAEGFYASKESLFLPFLFRAINFYLGSMCTRVYNTLKNILNLNLV